jgi:tetratricopeptide (TPR) repeat protein
MGWFGDRFERDEAPLDSELPARRRRLLLLSMILVVPLGVLAAGTGINVVLAAAVQQSFSAGDYQGAASWARAAVSLNPFDRYLPHYNLGTAYAAGDLLPEAVPELQTALDAAPTPEAACYPRANLALTYVRLGNRFFDAQDWQGAIDAYRAAQALWREQPDDVCHQDQNFDQTADQSNDEAQQGEDQAEQQQQQSPTPNPSQSPDPNPTPTPGQTGEPQPSPTPGESGEPQPSPTPGESGEPQPSPTPGQSGEPSPSPTPGQSGEPSPSPTPGQSGEPQPQPTSDALGDKLDELIAQGEAADRERENGGPHSGKGRKPW